MPHRRLPSRRLQTVAGEDGHLSAEDISEILTTFGEHTGQGIDASEIADVVALSVAGGATPESVAHTLAMNPKQRKNQSKAGAAGAEQRRV